MDDHRLNVLHLIDPGMPGGGSCTLKLLADTVSRLSDVRHDLIIIGNAGHVEMARSLGLRSITLLPPPPKIARLRSRTFRNVIGELERRGGRFDLIHGWTQRSAAMCGKALPRRKRLTTLAIGPDPAWDVRHLLPAEKHPTVSLHAFNSGIRDDLAAQGVPPESVRVTTPGIEASGNDDHAKRTFWRERWKVDDRAFVIGVLCQPLEWADARTAVSILIQLTSINRKIHMVLHHVSDYRVEAECRAREQGIDHLLIWEDSLAKPWEVAPGLDIALAYSGVFNVSAPRPFEPRGVRLFGGDGLLPAPGMLPSLYVMGAGIPVVGQDVGATREVHGDELQSLLVGSGDVLRMSDPIVRLMDDRNYYESMRARSREVIEERFSLDSFVASLRTAYDALGSSQSPCKSSSSLSAAS